MSQPENSFLINRQNLIENVQTIEKQTDIIHHLSQRLLSGLIRVEFIANEDNSFSVNVCAWNGEVLEANSYKGREGMVEILSELYRDKLAMRQVMSGFSKPGTRVTISSTL